jgi:hypothetical protein
MAARVGPYELHTFNPANFGSWHIFLPGSDAQLEIDCGNGFRFPHLQGAHHTRRAAVISQGLAVFSGDAEIGRA